MSRPVQLITINITRPNAEGESLKNCADLTAALAEGWTIGYGWIKLVETAKGDTDESFLLLLLCPPGIVIDALAGEERQAIAGLIEARSKGSSDVIEAVTELRGLTEASYLNARKDIGELEEFFASHLSKETGHIIGAITIAGDKIARQVMISGVAVCAVLIGCLCWLSWIAA